MRATVTQIECLVNENAGFYLYQVDYTDKEGFCPDEEWMTFNVYERDEVAQFVKRQIENGDIRPAMYVPPVAIGCNAKTDGEDVFCNKSFERLNKGEQCGRRDYRIIISADVNDTTYWQLLRKGEPAACNEQEIRMVSQILGELKEKIDKQYPPK